ncbi:uncharacterized protein Z520_00795 [Fonsecaea multimorphosa CBS 102226]|uniref:Lysozyme n=1 Tax=Fonsecaea multimorphosa CBS 102226 TaxID=1442371 RepID=A0A0D2KD97_9EURO|nr:uncharacterized protein Z520_00795 [Fonsecaea multimorphosa CBS 102226]KIY04103.1 hypothetical protein Z520_00795 [Fonsecaea multimorphosa CBS 102226]OAL31936.1 hypothetical protein AYO22_00806 [Fonsecaea multimorphosa]
MSQDNAKPTLRKLSDEGLEKLKELEGFKPFPSPDGKNGYSVGYGINSNGQPKLYHEAVAQIKKTGRGLTKEEAESYTKRAMPEYERSVRNLKNSENLKQCQFDAVSIMTYNKGGSGMRRKIRTFIEDGDMKAAYHAILNDDTKGSGGENLSSRRAKRRLSSPGTASSTPLRSQLSAWRGLDGYSGRTPSRRVGGGDVFGSVAVGGALGAAVGGGGTIAVGSTTVTVGAVVSSTGTQIAVSVAFLNPLVALGIWGTLVVVGIGAGYVAACSKGKNKTKMTA